MCLNALAKVSADDMCRHRHKAFSENHAALTFIPPGLVAFTIGSNSHEKQRPSALVSFKWFGSQTESWLGRLVHRSLSRGRICKPVRPSGESYANYYVSGQWAESVRTEILRLESTSTICLFHQSHFDWKAADAQEVPIKSNAAKAARIARDSLGCHGSKVDGLADALSNFFEPRSWVGAVDYAAQKTEALGGIVAVSANVVFRDLGVQSKKAIHVAGLGKDIRRVTTLRGFDDHCFLYVENVFLPKQIGPTRTPRWATW